jgi:transposase
MNEDQKYQIIKKLVETKGNVKRAALKLGVTKRHVYRLINGYLEEGKSYFIHGNKGRKPSNFVSKEVRESVLSLYQEKYYDANFTHFKELLESEEGIKLSITTIKNILDENLIISPKANRKTRNAYRKILRLKSQKKKISKKDKNELIEKLHAVDDPHPRRPRCKYFGEMIQMDASHHLWFGDRETHLHVAIDDSTGQIIGAYFDSQETLKGYYNVFEQILTTHGVPYMFFTDRRTIFEYKRKKNPKVEDDTFTQFGYACHQLGVEIKTSSIPQAKGRVERVFNTLQSRLIVELRLEGVTDLESANKFLPSYLKKFNKQFALEINHTTSVFETQVTKEQINLTLAVLANRKIDTGHSIRFDNKYYQPTDEYGKPVHFYQGTEALVIKAFDQKIYTTINDTVYLLEEIPSHARKSKNFDFESTETKPKIKKKYIPPMSHPWKGPSYQRYLDNLKHKKGA